MAVHGSLAWSLLCILLLSALLITRTVDSSPVSPVVASLQGQGWVELYVGRTKMAPLAAESGVTTIVTHAHNRILNALPSGSYAWHQGAGSSLKHALLDPSSEAGYQRKTYINQVPAADAVNRSMSVSTTTPMIEFRQVGFPQIESFKKAGVRPYKHYRATMHARVQKDGSKHVVANIRCHGYSPHRTHRHAIQYEKQVDHLAAEYNVDKHLVKAIIAQESCFRNQAVSPVGAVGLMQLMPETARWLGVHEYTVAQQNLKAGVRYLSQLIEQFGSPKLALAAYNAGPGNVRKYNGVPPFPETRQYIERVLTNYHSYRVTELFNSARM